MHLGLLALLQGFLCLTAASPTFQRSNQDNDYNLVKEVARKFFEGRIAGDDRRAQEEDVPPVVADALAPNTAFNQGTPLPDDENDMKQDGVHTQKEIKDGLIFAEETKRKLSADDVKGGNDAKEKNDKEIVLKMDTGNIDETIDNPFLDFLVIQRTAEHEDGEQKEKQQAPAMEEMAILKETVNEISALGKQLFIMSMFSQRLSEMLMEEKTEDLVKEDKLPEKTEDLVEKDKLPSAKMAGDASSTAPPKKENMAESEHTHVNDLVKPSAKDTGSVKAEDEHSRKKRSAGNRIYFPGELQEDEFGQEDEISSVEEFLEPGSHPTYDFDPDVTLETEVVGNGVGEGEGHPPPPDLSNDLGVNFPPRDSEFALEINPDAEIIDPELLAAAERAFRSGRRDK